MKCIVILFDDENFYENQKLTADKTACDLTKAWADSLVAEKKAETVKVIKKSACKTVTDLLVTLKTEADKADADAIIYSYADVPFINKKITDEILESHFEYKNEYTFADGYPYGFAPEVLDKGLCGILAEISKTTQAAFGAKKVERDSIWELLKTDINSFEVESVLADEDFRLLRYSFDCASKLNFLCCKNLAKQVGEKTDFSNLDANEVSSKASENPEVLKTVPSFYNIQLCDSINVESIYSPYATAYTSKFGKSPLSTESKMSFENCSKLIEQIAQFSEKAVISFSLFGEALNYPDLLKLIEKVLSYDGLSVFIETDGLKVTEEFCSKLKSIVENTSERTNGYNKVMVAVTVDAFTAETYKTVHKEDCFAKAVAAISLLSSAIPGKVYPQFTRMNCNEAELESFYRYWSEKANASGGELIIQKYDDFCGALPACKPADLSPVDRNVCWHLRRDLAILSNGDVIPCREYVFEKVVGNVFTDGLEKVWSKLNDELKNQINKNYCNKCGKCDEYYTFQF